MQSNRDFVRSSFRLICSLLSVGAITLVYSRVIPVNNVTVALTMLLDILAIASQWGLLPATAASFAGTLLFNFFFLPPVGTLTIADPQNWVALLAFLGTSVVGSRLSTNIKRMASEALLRQKEMESLYELSRSMMLLDRESPTASQVAHQIVRVFEIPGIAIFDHEGDEVYRAGHVSVPVPDSKLRDAAREGTSLYDETTETWLFAVRLGGDVVGSLAILGKSVTDAALHAICNLAAIAIEKTRAEEAASRVEAARQNEAMKATLLDALAHEFMTPLTSIKAAASSILYEERPSQQELVSIILEETERLNVLVRETIRTARIAAETLRLRKQPLAPAELVHSTIEKLSRMSEGRELKVDLQVDMPQLLADPELAEFALRQLITNAFKYSDPHSPITIRAVGDGNRVIISVKDRGPGIGEKDLKRIFEKFYRVGDRIDSVPGIGLGLHIAREILRAHGGELRVESALGKGSEFFMIFPSDTGNSENVQ